MAEADVVAEMYDETRSLQMRPSMTTILLHPYGSNHQNHPEPCRAKHNLDGIRLTELTVPFYLDPLVCEARLDGKLSKKAV